MRFAVLTNKDRDSDLSVTEKIAFCLSSLGAECAVVSSPSAFSSVVADCNAAVTVGGDGTILAIAQTAARAGCPVIGVNKGKLGYLAALEPDGTDELARLVTGDYFLEDRMMIKASVKSRKMPNNLFR